MLQGHAIQVLHGDEGLVAMPADFVDGANVRVIERGRGPGFAAKTLQRLRIAREVIGQEFEGDEAAEFGVFGFIDYAHAAIAKLLDDAVVRNGLVDHGSITVEEKGPEVPVASSYGGGIRASTNRCSVGISPTEGSKSPL